MAFDVNGGRWQRHLMVAFDSGNGKVAGRCSRNNQIEAMMAVGGNTG
jgi:hypothetical protein